MSFHELGHDLVFACKLGLELLDPLVLGVFGDLFAGRNLAPLPSPEDYAAKREAQATDIKI